MKINNFLNIHQRIVVIAALKTGGTERQIQRIMASLDRNP